MDHVDGVRPDVQPVGGDVLPVLSHKRGNKANLQKQKMRVKGTQAWENFDFFFYLNPILICPS